MKIYGTDLLIRYEIELSRPGEPGLTTRMVEKGIQQQPQGKDDMHLYVWAENQNTKYSNMVASALNHYFVNVATDEIQTHREMRLFSDSCFGKNN